MDNGSTTIAVLGTGSIGMRHLGALRRMADVRPIAVPKRRERLGWLAEAGFATAADLQGAIREGARLCIIATDTRQHVPDGLSASEQGLDILVEKPMAPDAATASQLRRRGRASGRKMFIGCTLRFSESLNTFRELLGQVGRLHDVRIECQSYLPEWRPDRPYRESYSARADEGGVLRDLIHEIDYAGWLFGWPATLQANVRNLGRLQIEADEAVDLLWETAEGAAVSLRLDYLSRSARRRLRASGERGTLEWDGIDATVTLALADVSARVIRSSQTRDEMVLAQAQAFIQASRGVVDPRLATTDDGVNALAVCDAARRASASRKEEPVEYPR